MEITESTGDDPRYRWLELEDLLIDKTGLLWAINRYLLHPRGYALGVHLDTETPHMTMLGDGSEPWNFTAEVDDRAFVAFETAFPVRLKKSSGVDGV